MKKRIFSVLVLVMTALMLATTVNAAAYSTYTYSYNGFALQSPDAYVPERVVDMAYVGVEGVTDIRDLEVDDEGNMYIVDRGSNRVIVTNRYYKLKFIIDVFTNEYGVPDSFDAPSGVCVTDEYIYVCDTDNNRIVMFDRDGNYVKIVPKPTASYFGQGSLYRPIAVAVDSYKRLFVVSATTYQGIIVMDDKANFSGFIGAQKAVVSPLELFWRNFMTDEQKEQLDKNVSTEFNNIAIDDQNFIYVTTSSIDEQTLLNNMRNRVMTSDFAPVKKLNSSGNDVMARNGFWPPAGEVDVVEVSLANTPVGPSEIVDVAVGPEQTWSIIDDKRSKVYTYDSNGNLLFIFGDFGQKLGNIPAGSLRAIVYKDDEMILLDGNNSSFVVYKRTDYGDLLIEALRHQNQRIYDIAVDDWMNILQRNSNFDTAYIGIGDALSRDADYEEAMEYYEAAYNVSNYSNAFREVRKEWVSKWIWTIPLVIIVVCVLLSRFFKYAARVNKETQLKVGKKSFKEELLYGFHLIFHPFDGFWDLKHEQRGSVRAGIVYLVVTILVFFYQDIGTGYIFNPTGAYSGIFGQILSVGVPLILWVVANWCLTTLFDGEGSLKDIFIATTYSLLPVPMLVLPSVIFSNILAENEGQLITLLVGIAFAWAGLLIFFGMMVTHDYSLGKNILTSVGTIVGMAFIIFVAVLFSSLVARMVSFVSSIVVELTYRI